MKTTKTILPILLALAILSAFAPLAFAVGDSGTDGNISWKYDDATKTLTVSGSGNMKDYDPYYSVYSQRPPWYSYLPDVEKIVVESGVTSIGLHAFESSGATVVELPEGLVSIGNCAFLDFLGTSIQFPSTLKSIGDFAFQSSELKTLELPEGIEEIGEYAFREGKFETLRIPAGIKQMGESCFMSCFRLKRLVIAGSVESFGTSVFSSCTNLQCVTIGEGLRTIPERAFFGCGRLLGVTIPKSVTTIETEAFEMCDFVRGIHYGGSQKDWDAIQIDEGNDCLFEAHMKYRNTKDFYCPWCGEVHVNRPTNDKFFKNLKMTFTDSYHRFLAALFGARYQ